LTELTYSLRLHLIRHPRLVVEHGRGLNQVHGQLSFKLDTRLSRACTHKSASADACIGEVRFTLRSRHRRSARACPLTANSGHIRIPRCRGRLPPFLVPLCFFTQERASNRSTPSGELDRLGTPPATNREVIPLHA
jgi:hypothetical protein